MIISLVSGLEGYSSGVSARVIEDILNGEGCVCVILEVVADVQGALNSITSMIDRSVYYTVTNQYTRRDNIGCIEKHQSSDTEIEGAHCLLKECNKYSPAAKLYIQKCSSIGQRRACFQDTKLSINDYSLKGTFKRTIFGMLHDLLCRPTTRYKSRHFHL